MNSAKFGMVPDLRNTVPDLRQFRKLQMTWQGFPGSSAGKESTCITGDPGWIPESGRSPGEGTGYPLQYSWASLVAQMVENPPAMQETWVHSLGWEDPLEKEMVTLSSVFYWKIPMEEQSGGLQSMGSQSWTPLSD